ncbi:MAG: glycosyltransferase [Alphaproteobacteria bacterium]
MKILQVMAGAARGGAETAFVDLCIAMKEAGEEVAVVTRPNDLRVPRLRAAGIEVHTLPFGGKIDVYTPVRLRRIIKRFQPDIVQGWMQRGPSKIPAWDARMGTPRYLVCVRLGGYYKLKYFRSADYFSTITPDIKRHLVEHGVDADRVREIYNFAETEDAATSIDRAEYGVPKDAPLLLGLGRLHVSKGFDVLIPAVAALPDVHLWIAGEGPQRAELESLIAAHDCGDRVRLLGWRSDRAALFQAADICVFSSRYEPFGTVFVQAWAEKTPLITCNADGPRQFVRDGEDGVVVPIDDVAAMRNAISRLVEDKALAARMVENGHKRYVEGFTKAQCVKNYLDFYTDIRAAEGL